MTTGIVVALPEELSTLTKKKISKGCCAFITDNLLIAHAGAGPQQAESAARLLLSKGAQHLISWGCCAALEPSLNAGDLCLPEIFITAEQNSPLKADSKWHHHAVQILEDYCPVFTDTLLESQIIISSAQRKNELNTETGCAVLDMESVAVARVAHDTNIPFLTIRAVADSATMDLPGAVNFALNDQGNVELKKLLFFLATHIYELPALIRLGLHFKAAGNTLKLVAKHLDLITNFDQTSTTLKFT